MKKSPLFIVFAIVFIDLMGFGIVIPLLPLYGERYHPSPAMFGFLMAVYSLMQFIFVPILGRFSDHFGRRPILILSLAGTVAGYVLFAVQGSLAVLLLSRIVAGVMGGNVATAQAVIADVTTPEKRAHGMGLIGAAFGLGFILGPAIGGFTYRFGESVPGFFAAALSATALLVTIFALPETWTPEKRAHAARQPRRWLSPGRLANALRHPQIGLLLVIFFLATFAFSNFEATFALFMNKRLSLNVEHVTYLFIFVGVLAAIVQGGLIGRLVKRYGERKLILAGGILLIPGYLALTITTSVPQLMFFLIFLALGAGLTGPSLSSLISRLSSEDEQGGILGVSQSVTSLARIVGPFVGVYAFTDFGIDYPYVLAAAAVAVVVVLAVVVLSRGASIQNVVTAPDGESLGAKG